MRILLDMDEVIEHLVATLLEKYNELHHTNYELDDVQYWEVPRWEPELWSVIQDTDVILDLPVKNNSIHYIQKWIEEGHEVFIVTNTIDPRSQELKKQWMLKHIHYFDLDRFVFTKYKHIIKGDIFVDDNIRNVRKWQEENPDGQAFLMTAQHNKDRDFNGFRITSLKDVDDFIYNR